MKKLELSDEPLDVKYEININTEKYPIRTDNKVSGDI